jgi:probable lipoprotein NlpC
VRHAICAALLVLLSTACATGERPPPALPPGAQTAPGGGASGRPALAQPGEGPVQVPGPAEEPAAGGVLSAEPPARATDELGTRLVERARSALGHRGPFTAGAERYPADCSGFVAWVFQAEGVPLRQLMGRVAPGESSGVAAAYQVVRTYGVVFGGGGEWPLPGDMVFFRDTYDRNRDGRLDDPFTHMGLVEQVDGGTVTFLHRGRHGVERGVLTLERSGVTQDDGGRELNTVLRSRNARLHRAPGLAGGLFMGYGRLALPRDVARR